MVSDIQKRARNKWDAANMTVLGCKVRKDKADQFRAACAAAGTSVNAVFMSAMDEFMKLHPAPVDPDAATALADPASTTRRGRGGDGGQGVNVHE